MWILLATLILSDGTEWSARQVIGPVGLTRAVAECRSAITYIETRPGTLASCVKLPVADVR